jgi:hypothetical protein
MALQLTGKVDSLRKKDNGLYNVSMSIPGSKITIAGKEYVKPGRKYVCANVPLPEKHGVKAGDEMTVDYTKESTVGVEITNKVGELETVQVTYLQ